MRGNRVRSVFIRSGHSAVTLPTYRSDVMAREIIGHESAAVSRAYTHLSTEDLRGAMQRVPDVTQ